MFDKLLPSTGWICVAIQRNSGFRHTFFRETDDALEYALQQDAKGEVVYLAQSTFLTRDNRTQANVDKVRSFWLDLDVGAGKPYATQKEAYMALLTFCTDAGLPLPTVVSSGNGLYAHWFLDRDLDPSEWKPAAETLKALTETLGLHADPSRTADHSSVLRPIGTTHRKDPTRPKEVRLVRPSEPVNWSQFQAKLTLAATAHKVNVRANRAPKGSAENDWYSAALGGDGAKADAERIKEKCQQIRFIANNQNEVDEPTWFAMLTLVNHVEDGHTVAHQWSCEYDGYDPAQVEAKLANLTEKNIGPTVCATFESKRPGGCAGCRHKDKITSPIQLGKVVVELPPDAVVPELPLGFSRAKDGMWRLATDEDDSLRFYDHDLFVSEVARDESLGYEVVTIRHWLPHEGWKEFTFRSGLTFDPKVLLMTLADNHVRVLSPQQKKAMIVYIESYIQKIQRQRKIAALVCQMGWKEDGSFVLGAHVAHPDGTATSTNFAKNVPPAVEAFHCKGELEPWVEATKIFRKPGMEAHAFAFLAGAFAAPLMKFTGYAGAMVAMLGASGSGKTLVGMWALSAYGQPDRLMMLKDDTKNALISRLGTYGTLPLYIDEITNINPEELSELVYRVTQGRDKARLDRNARERSVLNTWNTLAVVSSNASIVDRLSGLKLDSTAELCRVLEFPVAPVEHLNRRAATDIYRMLSENYGHAGQEYVKYLAGNQDKHQGNIDILAQALDARTEARNEERFWSAVVSATLYGGMLAKKLGLIQFDLAPIKAWAERMIFNSRATRFDVVSDAVAILGRFFDMHVNNRIVVAENGVIWDDNLRGPLHIRLEKKACRVYISRSYIREWLSKHHGSYSSIREELENCGVLLDSGKRKALGANTDHSGPVQPCWVLNFAHPLLGIVAASLVEPTGKKEATA